VLDWLEPDELVDEPLEPEPEPCPLLCFFFEAFDVPVEPLPLPPLLDIELPPVPVESDDPLPEPIELPLELPPDIPPPAEPPPAEPPDVCANAGVINRAAAAAAIINLPMMFSLRPRRPNAQTMRRYRQFLSKPDWR
jgi:hypothetical protein